MRYKAPSGGVFGSWTTYDTKLPRAPEGWWLCSRCGRDVEAHKCDQDRLCPMCHFEVRREAFVKCAEKVKKWRTTRGVLREVVLVQEKAEARQDHAGPAAATPAGGASRRPSTEAPVSASRGGESR